MVLGKTSVRRPSQAADREVESRGAVLPFVIAVGREVADLEALWAVAGRGAGAAVDLGVAKARPLVVELSAIADARHHEAVPDPRYLGLVKSQPGDRTDGA